AEARSKHGDLHLSGVSGDVQAETTDGKVVVRGPGGAVSAQSGHGDIEVENAGAAEKPVTMSSRDGSIAFSGAAGSLVAESAHGDLNASLTAAPASIRLTSEDGTVTLAVPPGTDLDLHAHTDDGEIDASGLHPAARSGPATGDDGEPPRDWTA